MAQRDNSKHRDHQHQVMIDNARCRPGRRPNADNAIITTRDFHPLETDCIGNLRESQSQHGQINALQAHDEKSEQGREETTCQGRGNQRRFHRHAELRHQKPTGIGAQTEIGSMAEAHDSAIPHQEIQRKGSEPEDQNLGRHLHRIGITK